MAQFGRSLIDRYVRLQVSVDRDCKVYLNQTVVTSHMLCDVYLYFGEIIMNKKSTYITGAIFSICIASSAMAQEKLSQSDQKAPLKKVSEPALVNHNHKALPIKPLIKDKTDKNQDMAKAIHPAPPVAPHHPAQEVVHLTPPVNPNKRHTLPVVAHAQAQKPPVLDGLDAPAAPAREGVYLAAGVQASSMSREGHTHYYGPGVHVGVGYQFNSNFAIQGDAQYAVKQHKDAAYSNHVVQTSLSVKGIYPVNKQVDAFGTLGVAYINQAIKYPSFVAKDKTHAYLPLVSVGAAYHQNANQDWTVSLSSMKSNGESHALWLNGVTVGVVYYL
jgi:hypothetical protein